MTDPLSEERLTQIRGDDGLIERAGRAAYERWKVATDAAYDDLDIGKVRWWATAQAALAELLVERNALQARIDNALALHQPKQDDPLSLVQHTYCSCGAMTVQQRDDGPVIAPAHYPCATVAALTGETP